MCLNSSSHLRQRAVVCIDRAAEANISRLLEEVRTEQPETVGMDTTDVAFSPLALPVRGTDVATMLSDERLQQELTEKQTQPGFIRMQVSSLFCV